eukprot:5073642-Pleurochrysis_carterae.AAC.2
MSVFTSGTPPERSSNFDHRSRSAASRHASSCAEVGGGVGDSGVVKLEPVCGERLGLAVGAAVLKHEHEERQEHRHARELLQEEERALEHLVQLRVVRAGKQRAEKLVVRVRVLLLVIAQHLAMVDLQSPQKHSKSRD